MRILEHKCSINDVELVVNFIRYHGSSELTDCNSDAQDDWKPANQLRLPVQFQLQNLAIRSRPIPPLDTQPMSMFETRPKQEETETEDKYMELGHMSPDTMRIFDQEFENAVRAIADEEQEARNKFVTINLNDDMDYGDITEAKS